MSGGFSSLVAHSRLACHSTRQSAACLCLIVLVLCLLSLAVYRRHHCKRLMLQSFGTLHVT